MLFTLVQATAEARVISWPQKSTPTVEQKPRVSPINGKPVREISYANK